MLDLVWPLVLLALPLPLIGRMWTRPAPADRGGQALYVPGSVTWPTLRTTPPRRRRSLLAILAWGLVVLAAARPEWSGDIVQLPRSGRDLMLALDLSRSMGSMDFELGGRVVTRLHASQLIAGEFIERRLGDRLGLILFGSQAYLQAPLTFDRTTVRFLLDEAELGLAGKSTAIGDAIGIAVKRLRRGTEPSTRVLVLITDGENTAGEIDPIKAAQLAEQNAIRIYTVGVSAAAGDGASQGEVDEATLGAIAANTGGRYFRAHNSRELEAIYAELDRLEPVVSGHESLRIREPLFMYPLALGLSLGLIAYTRLNRATRP